MVDDKLILALDFPNAIQGLSLVQRLGQSVSFYKIGLGMLTGGGLALADELKQEHNKKIFLDLKLFDIGATVENAVKQLARYDLDFLTVHGDPHVVKAAANGAAGSNLKILAVTILTSLDREDLDKSCLKEGSINELVQERAYNAFEAGANGVIASPNEITSIRQLTESDNKLIVTPGIRFSDDQANDQKRIASPSEAISLGANHIVVGRPVWQSSDPIAAVKKIRDSINQK
jgi:orotidine-5'-phosphate decarboxylase